MGVLSRGLVSLRRSGIVMLGLLSLSGAAAEPPAEPLAALPGFPKQWFTTDKARFVVLPTATGIWLSEETEIYIQSVALSREAPAQLYREMLEVEPGRSEAVVAVHRGVVGIVTSKMVSGSRLRFVTAHAEIEVRAKRVAIEVGETYTRVCVVEGDVTVALAKGGPGKRVSAGEAALVQAGIEVAKAEPAVMQRMDDLITMTAYQRKTFFFNLPVAPPAPVKAAPKPATPPAVPGARQDPEPGTASLRVASWVMWAAFVVSRGVMEPLEEWAYLGDFSWADLPAWIWVTAGLGLVAYASWGRARHLLRPILGWAVYAAVLFLAVAAVTRYWREDWLLGVMSAVPIGAALGWPLVLGRGLGRGRGWAGIVFCVVQAAFGVALLLLVARGLATFLRLFDAAKAIPLADWVAGVAQDAGGQPDFWLGVTTHHRHILVDTVSLLAALVGGAVLVGAHVRTWRREAPAAKAVALIAKRTAWLALAGGAFLLTVALCQVDATLGDFSAPGLIVEGLVCACAGFAAAWPVLRGEGGRAGRLTNSPAAAPARKGEGLVKSATTLANLALVVAAVGAYSTWNYASNLTSLRAIRNAFAADYLRFRAADTENFKAEAIKARDTADMTPSEAQEAQNRLWQAVRGYYESHEDMPDTEGGPIPGLAWAGRASFWAQDKSDVIRDLTRPPGYGREGHYFGMQVLEHRYARAWVAWGTIKLPIGPVDGPSATVKAIEAAHLTVFEKKEKADDPRKEEDVAGAFRRAESEILSRQVKLPALEMEIPVTAVGVVSFLLVCGLLRFFAERVSLLAQQKEKGAGREEWLLMDAQGPFTKSLAASWKLLLILAPWVLFAETLRGLNLAALLAGDSRPVSDVLLIALGLPVMLSLLTGTTRIMVRAMRDLREYYAPEPEKTPEPPPADAPLLDEPEQPVY